MSDWERVMGGLAALVLFLGEKGDPVSIEQAGICADALILLQEQEPVEPLTDDAWHYPLPVCGVCGTCLFKVGDYNPKFCSECGRAVKWDAL